MSSHTVPTVVPSGNVAVAAPPSGWYPDPRGSDQLRWWDGTVWTTQLAPRPASAPVHPEAAALAPAVPESTPLASAVVAPTEPVAPIAVEPIVVESAAVESAAVEHAVEHAVVEAAAVEHTAVEPVAVDVTVEDSVSVAPIEPTSAAVAPAAPTPALEHAARTGDTASEAARPGTTGYDWQRETERIAPMPSATPRIEQWDVRDVPSRAGTTAVWLLAFTPYLSLPLLVGADILVRGTSLDGGNSAVLFAALTLYALVFALATRDNTVLARRGHRRRAQPSWALLGAVTYLIVRTVNVRRETGVGAAPLWMWVVNLLVAAALLYAGVTIAGPIRDLDLLGGML